MQRRRGSWGVEENKLMVGEPGRRRRRKR